MGAFSIANQNDKICHSEKEFLIKKIHARIPRMHFIILLLPLDQKISAVYNFTTVPSYPVYPTSSASI